MICVPAGVGKNIKNVTASDISQIPATYKFVGILFSSSEGK